MYILKNAYLNIIRSSGRNILIGIIIATIMVGSFITLTINKSGNNLVNSYKNSNPLEVSFNLDVMDFRNAGDNTKEEFELLTLDDIADIGLLSEVNSYYYTLSSSLNSDSINYINHEELFKKTDEKSPDNHGPDDEFMKKQNNFSTGNFSIIAYSDISYNEDFINGNKKLLDGEMISKDNNDNVVVISEELASENSLEVGDTVIFKNISNEDITYELKIIGIYSITTNDNGMDFMSINSSNQLYTNLEVLNKILNDEKDISDYKISSSINAKFYVDSDLIEKFESKVRSLGISDYYKMTTNEDEVTSALKPIKNISSFSFTFLIIILIVGGIILEIINLFNIRERKYEIGVLRAIGMTKLKVNFQLITEIFMVSLISLVIGIVFGFVLSQPVTNFILKNEINSITEEENNIINNFGSEEFKRPGFGNRNDKKEPNLQKDIKYIDVLDVKIDYITIIELFGISLILTIVSSSVGIMFVNKYEPNKILQNRG